MNKYERYADAIKELKNNKFYIDFIKPYLVKANSEEEMQANFCAVYTTLELIEKNKEINRDCTIDWSKVEVDTPILVKNYEDEPWIRRYFAKYEDGLVYAWSIGRTSWTANTVAHMTKYYYAKLAEDEE